MEFKEYTEELFNFKHLYLKGENMSCLFFFFFFYLKWEKALAN